MKPWDKEFWQDCANRDDFDDLAEKLWSETIPEDFYFIAFVTPEMTSLVVTPAAYFDTHGYQYDQHVCIDHLLPPNYHTQNEGNFCRGGQHNTIVQEMLAKGFRQSPTFDKFIVSH